MKEISYQSTRGSERVSAAQAVLRGLAPDGGLYVSAELSALDFDWRRCLTLSAQEMSAMLLSALLPGLGDMETLAHKAYDGKFETEELTPLVPVGTDYALELYRGPTSAFKDVALSVLPRLITAARRAEGEDGLCCILTATSGDTGKAALEGFKDVEGTRVIVFFPNRGVSAVQKAQMLTQEGNNLTVCAVEGNFDDCQRGVKEAFAALGEKLPAGVSLSSANSINIGRLVPQLMYYFRAYADLVDSGCIKAGEEVDFTVPTGNFGDILAGYMAGLLGLPVGRLVCASNANRVLTDFFETGIYDARRELVKTASPSMDILVSSNLERLLFLVTGDTGLVRACMESLGREGSYRLPEEVMAQLRTKFSAACCSDAEAAREIVALWERERYLCDSHTAVGFACAEKCRRERVPMVVLSTASPYKFPRFVLSALGESAAEDEFADMEKLQALTGVPIPKNLAGLRERTVRHKDVIARDAVTAYVAGKLEEKA